MALKIFCNFCQTYIRDGKPSEVGQLRGDEICEDCSSHIATTFAEVDKIAKRGIVKIENVRDKIKADLENAMRNVIKSGVKNEGEPKG